jgi:hypothetical protein
MLDFISLPQLCLTVCQVREIQDQIKKMESRIAQAQGGNGPVFNAAEEAAKR